ncbi:MAG: site-specific integrase [Spirochaetales bacterium]|nr:site-specific integrase [Spirochaetales bacterium]
MITNEFSLLLTTFLAKYLPGQRNLSHNTISSYRDCFKLFLVFCTEERKLNLASIQLNDMERQHVIAFLNWLEESRKCSNSTRNQRLAALKSFAHFVASENPEYLFQCQQIAAIPMKRTRGRVMNFLSPEGIHALLLQTDTRTWRGCRDHALLVLMYDCALRVQELIDLTIGDLRLDSPAVVKILGKGRKYRIIPITSKTANILSNYIHDLKWRSHCNLDSPLFQNNRHSKLTRVGVSGILQKHIQGMKIQGLSHLIPGKISPHSLRHSKAVHLLRSGVPLIYIRDFLGHSSVTTTEIYAKIDSEEKRKAIENAYPVQSQEIVPSWEKDENLINWLSNFCK